MNTLPPLAVMAGVRTPFCKAFTLLDRQSAVQLGSHALRSSVTRAGITPADVDEVVFGNVAGPPDAANIARVIALQSGVPRDRIAHTVNRNCGSGIESLIAAWHAIANRRAQIVVAGGTESMSRIPLLFRTEAARVWTDVGRAKKLSARLRALAAFRPRHFRPVPAIELGLTDPVSGLNMGQTAELLAGEFKITREAQDAFALESHRRAAAAQERCFFSGEIAGIELSDETSVERDNGIRHQQSLEQLARLHPLFGESGTVTAGNSCQLTDGAAAVVVVSADEAGRFDSPPLGYVRDYAIAGCDPNRMGLGPVYATEKLLRQTELSLADFDLVELNEAFAAQVIACRSAAESATFAQQELGRDRPLGCYSLDRLNINGGAIALGHPVGATGMRLVVTMLRCLRERQLQRGLVTLCIGGGQGMALLVESNLEGGR